jgi:hypothetical protein
MGTLRRGRPRSLLARLTSYRKDAGYEGGVLRACERIDGNRYATGHGNADAWLSRVAREKVIVIGCPRYRLWNQDRN